MKHRRLSHIATLGLIILAVAAPSAMADQDFVSPDARDAATTRSASPAGPHSDRFDKRSPDARDAATAATPSRRSQASQDKRSPDARDAAQRRGTFSAPEVTVVKVTEPAPASGGLDWSDAGLGAGAMLGLMLVGLGGMLGVAHRRQTAQRRHRPATIA